MAVLTTFVVAQPTVLAVPSIVPSMTGGDPNGPGLSDGGAHCGTICDAASPTFLLQHWVRDRKRGKIPLELAIKKQCRDTALLYGMEDRGLLKAGYLADVNVIDLEKLKLGKPWLAFDLPAGGKRLLQTATYVSLVAIIVGLVGWIEQSYISEELQ